ncbi:MAG: hypothetical protein IKE91_01675 [Clostridia bacterium]|nr:hypothetical protein [Clostridia bacterium]
MGGVVQNFLKDIAEFFAILTEGNLAFDTYENGRIEVTADHNWILTNIAEILSTDGVVCHVIETTDTEYSGNGTETAKITRKLCVASNAFAE